jgi:hypothetical protein
MATPHPIERSDTAGWEAAGVGTVSTRVPSLFAAVLLGVAAWAKLSGPNEVEALGLSVPARLIAAVELGLATTLLGSAFLAHRWGAVTGFACFSALAVVAASNLGKDRCECFGKYHVSPWFTLATDASLSFAFAALLFRVNRHIRLVTAWTAVTLSVVLIATVLLQTPPTRHGVLGGGGRNCLHGGQAATIPFWIATW